MHLMPLAPALTQSTPQRTAVIGGGIAGLACARRLQQLGHEAVCFDTGKHAPGGRCSSRTWPGGATVDHAAQYATARSASFSALMKELETEGLVKQWPARVVALEGGAAAVPVEGDAVRYVGADGMGGIAAALARGLDVRQDVWVPPNGGITYESDGMWRLRLPSGAGDDCRFDAVVIAHNGKCAERLTSSVPARDVHSLLRTRFAASLPGGGREGGGVFTLNSVYSLAFEAPAGVMPSDFDAAEVRGGPLRWLANNAAKYGPADGGGEVWTALSTGAFGKAHKVPQEQLAGTEAEAEVTAKLLRAVEAAVGLEPEALKPLRTRLQLWGAALPLCRWDDPYVWGAPPPPPPPPRRCHAAATAATAAATAATAAATAAAADDPGAGASPRGLTSPPRPCWWQTRSTASASQATGAPPPPSTRPLSRAPSLEALPPSPEPSPGAFSELF